MAALFSAEVSKGRKKEREKKPSRFGNAAAGHGHVCSKALPRALQPIFPSPGASKLGPELAAVPNAHSTSNKRDPEPAAGEEQALNSKPLPSSSAAGLRLPSKGSNQSKVSPFETQNDYYDRHGGFSVHANASLISPARSNPKILQHGRLCHCEMSPEPLISCARFIIQQVHFSPPATKPSCQLHPMARGC